MVVGKTYNTVFEHVFTTSLEPLADKAQYIIILTLWHVVFTEALAPLVTKHSILTLWHVVFTEALALFVDKAWTTAGRLSWTFC